MGQYLVIGIVTRIEVDMDRQNFKAPLKEVRKSLENKFNQNNIYDVEEDDDYIVMDLKPEIAEPDWEAMIREFYDLFYQDHKEYCLDFDKLDEKPTTLEEWIDLAETKSHQGYQKIDQYYYFYGDEIEGWSRYIDTRQYLIGLSLDGKIIMECYDHVLDFFTRLIKEKLGKYRLADSLSVQICG